MCAYIITHTWGGDALCTLNISLGDRGVFGLLTLILMFVSYYFTRYNPNWNHHKGKVKIQYMTNAAERRKCRNGRQLCLFKKSFELITLTGGKNILIKINDKF